jgi:hypothetical protein
MCGNRFTFEFGVDVVALFCACFDAWAVITRACWP